MLQTSCWHWDVMIDATVVECVFSQDEIVVNRLRNLMQLLGSVQARLKPPGIHDSVYPNKFGLYEPGCNLDKVTMSWST
jgi:hypothetical protein